MSAAPYFDQIQSIYIAFYQRPADPAGLRYWAGQASAAGGDLSQVIDAFAASPEAAALYGSTIDSSSIGGVIDSLYVALFNRPPDALGRQFYIDGFAAGTFTPGRIVLGVLAGAQNSDAAAIDNKLQVANVFTQQVDGRAPTDPSFGMAGFAATYAGDAAAAAARAFLAGVTFDPATVLTPAQVANVLQTQIAQPGDPILAGGDSGGGTDPEPVDPGPGPDPVDPGSDPVNPGPDPVDPDPDPVDPGPDPVNPDPNPVNPDPDLITLGFALTTGKDRLVGTDGDDVFTGTGLTLQDGDSLDGKGGVNTLRIQDESQDDLVFPIDDVTVQNIQHLEVSNAAGDVQVDVQGWQGLESIVVDQRDEYGLSYIHTANNVRSVGVKGGTWIIDIYDNANPDDLEAPSDDVLAHVAIENVVDGRIRIKSDALTSLSLAHLRYDSYYDNVVEIGAAAGVRALALALDGVDGTNIKDATATTINMAANGADSNVALEVKSATAVHIDGSARVVCRISGDVDGFEITSTNTAGVEVGPLQNNASFTGGSGDDMVWVGATTQTINMGDGDDIVGVSEMLGTGGKLDGGAGTDTLEIRAELAAELSAAAAANSALVQGFEVLSIYGPDTPDTTYTIDLAALGGISHVVSYGTWVTSPLVLTDMADGGVLELTGANKGPITVAMADAASVSDRFNIKLNGPSYIRSTGVITVDNVENIHITATNSDPSGPPQSDPWSGVSALRLHANAVEKIVLSGNHGVDFDQSDFGDNFVELDASGVTGTGDVGRVIFEAGEMNKSIRVKTGHGDDSIDLRALLGSSAAADQGATVLVGAGDNEVIGSSGADHIAFGAGNDTYILVDASHSSAAAPDVITGFSVDTDMILIAEELAQKSDGSGGWIDLHWFNVQVFDNATAATAFINSAGNDAEDEVNIALDSGTGLLYIDVNDDGVVDSVIELAGVSAITDAAFGIA